MPRYLMDAKQFIRQIQAARDQIRAERPANTLRISFSLLAQVKLRIQTSGRSASGAQFPDYNPVYAVYGRDRQGYQSDYVDFTRQGRMWASISPQVIGGDKNKTIIEIRARDAENQTKLNGQFAKRGNILQPSEEEIEIARQANDERIVKIIQSVFQ